MTPVRHALAALLSDQKHFARALPVYRTDLRKHPDNIWSLTGLLECLERLGKDAEIVEGETGLVKKKVEQVRRDADVDVTVSCYCRR